MLKKRLMEMLYIWNCSRVMNDLGAQSWCNCRFELALLLGNQAVNGFCDVQLKMEAMKK